MGLNNGTKAESWEISQRNGKPGIFTRNGKEWFDADTGRSVGRGPRLQLDLAPAETFTACKKSLLEKIR